MLIAIHIWVLTALTVQQKSGDGWVSIPWLKSLQHARDVLAKRERDRHNEDLKEELRRKDMLTGWRNEELSHDINELKDTVETMKREQQHRDMDQQFREMNRQNEESYRRSFRR